MAKIWEGAEPKFFSEESEFRQWLQENHDSEEELWVGYYKKATDVPSITWPQSVDQALCFGWIDGIRKSLDEKRYMIRFTPRRPKSIWSAVNLKRFKELKAQGQVEQAGLDTFKHRSVKKSGRYSYERDKAKLTPEYRAKLKEHEKAWAYFNALPPSARKASVWWIMSAKRESTRRRRLAVLIGSSEKGQKIPPLRIGKKG